MVVIYTVPSNKYKMQPAPGIPLDEIDIEAPAANQTLNGNTTAQFTLQVKTAALTKVVASITLTRFQNIYGGAGANLGPAVDAVWSFATQPSSAPYEAFWTMAPTPSNNLPVNSSKTFKVQFNTGSQAGIYRLTFRVQADELTDPVETTFDMVVA